MIYDADEEVYQVPEEVFPRPESSEALTMDMSDLKFSFETDPFSFTVSRRDTGEILFDTSGSNLVFQTQYLNLKTSLPDDPNLYGLGEHSDPLRLNTTDYTRTLWNRDSYGLPYGGNLYGSHAIYVDHRGEAGSHGVFMLNSNGMDIKINKTEKGDQYLEYNIIGGVIDLYFLAGPTPKEVAAQYAEVVGLPAMMPYWSFGVSANDHNLLIYYLYIDFTSSINAVTDTGMFSTLRRSYTTILLLESRSKRCGQISIT